MAPRTAVCQDFAVLTLGMLLLLAPTALEAQEQRSVTVGAAIVECANRQAIEAAKRILADHPIALLNLQTEVVKDSPLFSLTVFVPPSKRERSTNDESDIVATIHFPRN